MSQERRKDFAKQASKMAEEGKVAIRQACLLLGNQDISKAHFMAENSHNLLLLRTYLL